MNTNREKSLYEQVESVNDQTDSSTFSIIRERVLMSNARDPKNQSMYELAKSKGLIL